MTASGGDGPAEYLLPPRLSLPDATPDPARLARRVLHAVIPGFADAAGIFVLEELLSGNPAGRTAASASAALVVRRLAGGSARSGELPAEEAFPPGQVLVLPPVPHTPAACATAPR